MKTKNYWSLASADIISKLGSSPDGLSSNHARQLLLEKGENVLDEQKPDSIIKVFFSQFCDLLIVILLIAALISMFSGNIESTIVIFLVLIMNAVLGTIQHVKAQRSLESLKQLSSPSAKVIRDGSVIEIHSKDIVPGDIIMLEAGDLIVADCRIIESFSLQVNESALTGESANVDKFNDILSNDTPLADRTNMVYSGSLVTYGRAKVIVTSTGMDTEIGNIAGLMNSVKERKTPLQVSLDDFSKKLAIMIMIICGLVFALCLVRKMPMLDSMMFAVALAVAAIPEALSSIVTIVQAMGTRKMAKENAIIKQLKAVESLGCVSVICSDKTGTLTQNKMTVQNIYINSEEISPEQLDISLPLHRYLLYDAILTNDSCITDGKCIGDPTESALLEMLKKVPFDGTGNSFNENHIRNHMQRIEELPFDSVRKLMSTKYYIHNVPTVLTKGAVDVLLDRCSFICDNDGVRKINSSDIDSIKQQNEVFSRKGQRVLAFAYKECHEPLNFENENDFIFIGLISMIDPPRPEAVQAVKDARRAGIMPVMITGDHKITATAIAEAIGIFRQDDIAVTGSELDSMSDEELDSKLEKISVYARVSPENKIRIVERWQNKGRIVSMTGDGVNDAPALKKADVGVAMGITGTEVSKDASDMILADDNFATIIKAVTNGRCVYRNIRNAILFLLSGNMAAILAVLYTSIAGLPVPFAPVQLLFINLLTDSLPAIAIGMEPVDDSLLDEKPRDPSQGILTKSFLFRIIGQGFLIAIAVMTAYYLGYNNSVFAQDAQTAANPALAMTMAFATLTLARLFHGFNCRTDKPISKAGLFSNIYSVSAFCAGICLLIMVLAIPFLGTLFSAVTLSKMQLLQIIILAFVPTMTIQILKSVAYMIKKH